VPERVEWTHAKVVQPKWLTAETEAPDGQKPEAGGGGLLLGPVVIEGEPDELLDLLDRAASVVDAAKRRTSAMVEMSKGIREVLERHDGGGGLSGLPTETLTEFAAIVSAFGADLQDEVRRRAEREG
jgi:hypothetical protein